jgi:putative glutathione S-transferase
MTGAVDSHLERGEFVRQQSRFRDWVTADGSSGYRAEPGRYHLYVAIACPWSHRAVIVRKLKGLEDAIGVSWIHPYRDERGWAFPGGEFTDDLHGWDFLSEAYDATVDDYDGRVSVPVLWDKETGRIVSNESADIIRMLGSEFDEWGDPSVDLYPEDLRAEIDELDDWIYANLNNGVYQAGFAESQEAYDAAYGRVARILPELEERLSSRRYLTGDRITEADWRLFVTLVRFDAVYHTHFRCNGVRIAELPNLWGYTRDLYQQPGVAETVDMDQIKRHYYTTHDMLNPKRIIPAGGPRHEDFMAPHGRS